MMKNKKIPYSFKNEVKDNVRILTLSGTVAKHDFWNDESVISANLIRQELDNETRDIVIRLNSSGGDVFEGIEIYNYLKAHSSHITIEITALAASAASIICMGADKVVMCKGATFMIHEASTFCFGNKNDVQKVLNALESIDDSLISIYYDKTGIAKEELHHLMTSETWFTADETVAKGFADEIKQENDEKIKSDNVADDNNIVAFHLPKDEEKNNKQNITALQRFFLGGQHDN